MKELKIELRCRAAAERTALTPTERMVKTKRINDLLIHRLSEILESRVKPGRRPTLFTYMPIKSELDVTPVMEAFWTKGYRILIPKVQPQQRLKLFEVRSFADLEKGAWGIPEPVSAAPLLSDIKQIDAVLVPGLAFDIHLGRLGYGGGYYDRFMQQFVRIGLAKPYTIAGAFDLQIIKEVPMGLFDFRLDELITEERTIRAAKTAR
jgi:5-formyltetrahydrofolate cyclo-ligase